MAYRPSRHPSGLPFEREHFLQSGIPKVVHQSMETAQRGADVMNARNRALGLLKGPVRPYRCGLCNKYHCGSRPLPHTMSPRGRERESLVDELGERAVGCLLVENHDGPRKRYHQIMKRFTSIERRRR